VYKNGTTVLLGILCKQFVNWVAAADRWRDLTVNGVVSSSFVGRETTPPPFPLASPRNGSHDVVAGYGLDDRGSFPWQGRISVFATTSGPALGPTQPSVVLKRPERGADSPPSSAQVNAVSRAMALTFCSRVSPMLPSARCGVLCNVNCLKTKLVQIIFKNSVLTAKKTPHFTVTKINRLTAV
jgi:hypothetical protein